MEIYSLAMRHEWYILNEDKIDLAGDHEKRRDRRIRTGGARWLWMRLQCEEKRLHLLGFGLSQRWPNQRDAIRANAGAESAGYGRHDKEFEEVIDARLAFII